MRAIRNFCRDTRGNVATMFALAIVPVVGMVGASVDYSRASGARTAMQAALDSTALAMSKVAGTVTDAQLQQSTLNYFNALYTRPEARNVSVSATYTTQGGTSLTVNGSGSVQTNLMNVLGYSSLNFSATSTVSWGSTKLRVALALDNTGSMADAGKSMR